MPNTRAPVSSNRFVRMLDTWGLVALIAGASLGQLGWTATHTGHHDSSRPGLAACVLLQTEPGRMTAGTECNAIKGYCKVTATTTCSAVGPVPYLQ